jgi:hypothetical protein
VSWGCTVAALVGVGAAAALARLHARRPRVSVVAAVAGVAVLAVGGHPMFARDTSSTFQPPFHWQRGDATRRVTADVIALTRPGDLVLAPSGLAITLVVTDTDLRSVAPRDYVLDQLRDVPSFHFPERLVLVNFVNDVGDWQLPAVAHALRVLDVDVACVWTHDVRRYHALRTLGYKPVIRTESYRCLTPGVRPARRG